MWFSVEGDAVATADCLFDVGLRCDELSVAARGRAGKGRGVRGRGWGGRSA